MKGLALIVVVGVLGVLAVLAAAFVAMAQLERRASEQRVNAARAYLLARSGIEDALARLGLGQDGAYGGEDWLADGDQGPGSFDRRQEIHRPGALDVEDCPVRHALRPSFFVRDGFATSRPALQEVEGRLRGYSGRLGHGAAYALRVSPPGGFFLNGGDPEAPPQAGYNAVLRRMLGTLAKALDEEAGGIDGMPVSEDDGRALVDARPSGGWRSLAQVRDLALGGSRDKLAALAPYLALHARVDRKVIAPNADAAMAGRSCPSWADIKLAHAAAAGSRAPDFERIPVKDGRIVGRAPVDLAWARRREPALIALLGGLEGLFLDESKASAIVPMSPGDPADSVGTLAAAGISLAWSPADETHQVARRILTSTSRLATWGEWDAFCDALPDALLTGTTDQRQAKRDILKANFNPDGNLNKFNPNASLWRSVDKQDLLVYSAEFALQPLSGARELACFGRVTGQAGRLLAGRALRALAEGPALLRLTTQKEFVCEDLGAPGVAGDESGYRLPGSLPFISLGGGAGRTWGHALPGLGGRGASLQTYPEPVVDGGDGLSINPADYDGAIQMATVETGATEDYGVASGTRDLKLLARFTDSFDLGVSDAAPLPGGPLPPFFITPDLNHPDFHQVTSHCAGIPGTAQVDLGPPLRQELRFGLLHATKPNTLYPDGCYSEKDRAPEYLDRGNAHGFHGVMSLWIKPSYGLGPRNRPYVKWSNFLAGDATTAGPDQFFLLGDPALLINGAGSKGAMVVCHFEIGHNPLDTDQEHKFLAPRGLPPRTWHLVTMSWDFRTGLSGEAGELVVDDGAAASDRGPVDVYSSSGRNAGHLASDITEADIFGPHRIALGRGHPEREYAVKHYFGSGADATFDEFAIWDFGGAVPTATSGLPTDNGLLEDPATVTQISSASSGTLAAPSVLALNRFREGRYYRESAYHGLSLTPAGNTAGEWFSAPLRLPAARVKGLAWSQVVPEALPAGAVCFDLADASGSDHALDTQGRPIDRRLEDPAFSPLGRSPGGAFRLHAVFRPNPADPFNTPILDPLTLQDVTVLYEPAGGPGIAAWMDGDAD